MNLSDVKTQSPPESGLPSAVRLGDHKSRGIYNRISFTYWHTVCNTDVKELTDLYTKKERERERENEREQERGEKREHSEIRRKKEKAENRENRGK